MKNYYPYYFGKGLAFALFIFFASSTNANVVNGNATSGGEISQNQTICPGTTPQLFQNLTVASGGDSDLPIEYLWMTSNTLSTPVSSWNIASGVNNGLTYQASPVGVTTYFVRCARRQGFTEFAAESNIVQINILGTAFASINGAPSGNIYTGSTVNLSATPAPGASYSWDFNGDGITDCSGINCSYTYNTTGVFPVTLTVTSAQGCPSITTIPVNVISPTAFGFNDPCNCGNPLNFATPNAFFVNDFILINSSPGQTWTLSNVTSGQVYDANGSVLPAGTIIPETNNAGQYFLNIWFVSGTGYGATFSNGVNNVSTGTNNPCSCTNPLPVELIDFTAEEFNGNVLLKWKTASETNNNHFQIQRSIDGIRFDYLDLLEGAGTTNQVTEYSYEDKTPLNGRTYYRLKQVDLDGSFEYSPIRQVYLESNGISIYPSPAKDFVTVRSLKIQNADATIEIVNADARLIHRYVLAKEDGIKTISLVDFDPGVYFVRIKFANGSYETGSFMKN